MQRSFHALICAVILAAFPIHSSSQQAPAADSFAIEQVTVINVETGASFTDQTVVVTGHRISAIGPAASVEIPAGARVVDGRGRFLIPGLWDMHAHPLHNGVTRTLPLAVANGVTGVRDMGSSFDHIMEAQRTMSDGLIGPRLFVSGPLLDGVLPNLPGIPPNVMIEITTPARGRQIVNQLARMRVDHIKIHNALSKETYEAIVEEAKKWGLPFEGHVPLPEGSILAASDAGQRSIEHLAGLTAMCAADPTTVRAPENRGPIEIDRARCEETVRHLARNGTWLTPTIGAPGAGDLRTRQFNLSITLMAFQAGVPLLTGTDWPGPAYSIGDYRSADRTPQDEMAGMVEAGLTPLEALRTATLNPAIMLGMTDQLGGVDRGKLADLLLLDADPLVDISNTKRITAVVVNGRLIDNAERQSLLDNERAAREASNRP